jgi:hypothetical protein
MRLWQRLAAVCGTLVLTTALLTACSGVRTSQGTSDESCYLELPTAAAAVHGHGHLAGIRKFTLSEFHTVAPRLYKALAGDVPAHQSVCVAAYTGHFTAASVEKPLGRPSGILAVPVVTSPGKMLLGTLILSKLPVKFQHMF